MAKKFKKPERKIVTKAKIKPLSLTEKSREVQENKNTTSEKVKKTKVRVVGIGGGGGSIVSEIAIRVEKASFVAANTDRQALRAVNPKVFRFQFGENLTKGLGTGMDAELACQAALNEKERIKKLFQGQDFCILIASLGGGCGSGAGPVFAKVAKNLGILTLGVFTLPFKFEGERKMEIAKEALQKLRPSLNAIIVLPNERIFQVIEGSAGSGPASGGKNIPLRDAFSAINKTLSESLEGLIETIYLPGVINIDFADLKTVLQGQGRLAFLNTVEVRAKKGGQEYIKRVISSPLYPYTVKGARGVLFNIAGEKELSLSDVSQISKTISEMANPEAKIIFGVCQNKKYQDKIKVTLLATGCSTKIFSGKEKKPKPKKKRPKKLLPANVLKPKKKKRILPKKKKAGPESPKKEEKKPFKKIPRTKKRKQQTKKIPLKIKESSHREIEKKSLALIPREDKPEVKIRKNGLQLKKEAEEVEKEILDKEKIWEMPTFLRLRINRQKRE